MPRASRHKLTPADGDGDRKRLTYFGREIVCELPLAGFLFLTFGSASVVLQNPSRDGAWERHQAWQLSQLQYIQLCGRPCGEVEHPSAFFSCQL